MHAQTYLVDGRLLTVFGRVQCGLGSTRRVRGAFDLVLHCGGRLAQLRDLVVGQVQRARDESELGLCGGDR